MTYVERLNTATENTVGLIVSEATAPLNTRIGELEAAVVILAGERDTLTGDVTVKDATITDLRAQLAAIPEPVPEYVPGNYRPELDFTADYTSKTTAVASYAKVESPTTITGIYQGMMVATVPDTATGVTDSPRMQAQTPAVIRNGDEFWWTFDVAFPSDFPVIGPTNGFVQIAQFYGQPFAYGAPFTLTLRSDYGDKFGTGRTEPWEPDIIRWSPSRDNPQLRGMAWESPKIVRGARWRFKIRFRVSDSLEDGFAEIWLDTDGTGYKQQDLYGGVKRLPIILWGGANNIGPCRTDAQVYRRKGTHPSITILHGNHTISRP